MADADYFSAVSAHYGRFNAEPAILDALRAAGKDLEALTPEDVAPFTHLTGRPKVATVELGRLAALQPGQHVLDVGSGLGGPARTLATEFGCRVTGLDLTPEFVSAATTLTERVGLDDRVRFQQGNALALPFPDGSFDVVWTEQFAMHVGDKARLYQEFHRVLRPGGRFAMREFLAGPVAPLHFPVPWARDPAISNLWTPEAVRAALAAAWFAELAWEDLTAADLTRRRESPPADTAAARPRTGGELFMGADLAQIQQNLARNYAEGRLLIVQGVFQRA
jgi:SAM-dependent methyltransferase